MAEPAPVGGRVRRAIGGCAGRAEPAQPAGARHGGRAAGQRRGRRRGHDAVAPPLPDRTAWTSNSPPRASATRSSLEHPTDSDSDERSFATVVGQEAGTLGARIKGGASPRSVWSGQATRPNVADADRAGVAGLTATARPRTIDLPGFGPYRVSVQPAPTATSDHRTAGTGRSTRSSNNSSRSSRPCSPSRWCSSAIGGGDLSCGCRCGRSTASPPPPPGCRTSRLRAARCRCPNASRTRRRAPRSGR